MARVILPCTGDEFLRMPDQQRDKLLAGVVKGCESLGLTVVDLYDIEGEYITSIKKDEPARPKVALHTVN